MQPRYKLVLKNNGSRVLFHARPRADGKFATVACWLAEDTKLESAKRKLRRDWSKRYA